MPEEVRVGPYRGEVAGGVVLDGLEERLAAGVLVSRPGRAHPVVRVELGGVEAAVKRYPRRHAYRARRSFELASALRRAGVGTPRPLAWLESPTEALYVCEHEADPTSFHTELLRLFREDFLYGRVLDLMDPVSAAARAMHDAGVRHGDLGNQNVLVRRTAGTRSHPATG